MARATKIPSILKTLWRLAGLAWEGVLAARAGGLAFGMVWVEARARGEEQPSDMLFMQLVEEAGDGRVAALGPWGALLDACARTEEGARAALGRLFSGAESISGLWAGPSVEKSLAGQAAARLLQKGVNPFEGDEYRVGVLGYGLLADIVHWPEQAHTKGVLGEAGGVQARIYARKVLLELMNHPVLGTHPVDDMTRSIIILHLEEEPEVLREVFLRMGAGPLGATLQTFMAVRGSTTGKCLLDVFLKLPDARDELLRRGGDDINMLERMAPILAANCQVAGDLAEQYYLRAKMVAFPDGEVPGELLGALIRSHHPQAFRFEKELIEGLPSSPDAGAALATFIQGMLLDHPSREVPSVWVEWAGRFEESCWDEEHDGKTIRGWLDLVEEKGRGAEVVALVRARTNQTTLDDAVAGPGLDPGRGRRPRM